MDIIHLLPFLGVSVPESLVLYYMALTLAGVKGTLAILVLLSFLTAFISHAVRSLPLVFGIHTFVQVIFMVFFLNLFFRIPWRLAIIVMVMASIILGLAESVSVPLLANIFSLNLQLIISDPLLRIIFTLPHLAILAAVIYIANRRGWRLPLLERMMVSRQGIDSRSFYGQTYLLIIALVQALMLVLMNISFYIYSAEVFPSFKLSTLVTYSSLVIIATAIVTIVVAGYLLKSTVRESKLETELLHLRETHKMNLQMRIQRHDFYNHLTAVYGYIRAGQYQQAESYIENLNQSVRQIEELMVVNPPEMGALLSVKQEEAKALGIEFHWQIDIENSVLPVSPEALTQLAGNLLDNALTAAAASESPRVDLSLTSNKLGMVLKVANSGEPIPQDVSSKIFDAGYTTKKTVRHGGLGLFIVRQLVDHHGGRVELVEPEDYHGVQFVIYIPWKD